MSGAERLYLRVDATPDTGLGHFMRCLALAQGWRDRFGPVTFIGQHGNELVSVLSREGIDVESLTAQHPDPSDLKLTSELVPPGSPLVLDGYHFDFAYQERLAEGRRLLVIDDTGHLPAYAGSVLLNANICADEIVYARAPATRLIGPDYALLRREILAARAAAPKASAGVHDMLITLGGADLHNITAKVLRALIAADMPALQVRVIVGPLNSHRELLEALAHGHRFVEILPPTDEMHRELLQADVAIASAGSITAELAYLGIPSLLIAIADNQLGVGRGMASSGAAAYAGDGRQLDERELRAILERTLADQRRLSAMRQKGPTLVDGRGATRVCNALMGVRLD